MAFTFTIKFLSPTNTRGARLAVSHERGKRRTYPFDYETSREQRAHDVLRRYAEAEGIDIPGDCLMIHGHVDDSTDVWIVSRGGRSWSTGEWVSIRHEGEGIEG